MGERVVIILFDLDGTLIDSTEAILESFHHSLSANNMPSVSDSEIASLIGHPLEVMFDTLSPNSHKTDQLVASYKEHYRIISTQKTTLLEGAKEAIELASTIAQLGIVTTKTASYSKILMEHFGVMHHFKTLIGRENVTHPKPHKEPILKALESFDTTNKEIWMIGDTPMDLLSAKDANINSIALLCGYSSEDELQKYTNFLFKNSLDAINFLQNR